MNTTSPAPRPLSRRALLKRAGLVAGGLVVPTTLVGGYSRFIEGSWIKVLPVQVTMPRLHPAFSGYRIAQISDIHLDNWMTPERLRDAVRQVNAQNADLIVITGDFLTAHPSKYLAGVAELSALKAPDGVLSVLGNHDHWSGAGAVREALDASHVPHLDNQVRTLERGNALLHIAGVDDVWEEKAQLDVVLGRLPREGAAILLAHEPDFATASAEAGRFDLELSGHSHGGQVIMPGFGPLHLPYLGRNFPIGRYQVGTMTHYTNRGLGMLRPHVRLNCRPEITVLTLRAPGM
jgi:predicted MPP superfamily phosphohydrolase